MAQARLLPLPATRMSLSPGVSASARLCLLSTDAFEATGQLHLHLVLSDWKGDNSPGSECGARVGGDAAADWALHPHGVRAGLVTISSQGCVSTGPLPTTGTERRPGGCWGRWGEGAVGTGRCGRCPGARETRRRVPVSAGTGPGSRCPGCPGRAVRTDQRIVLPCDCWGVTEEPEIRCHCAPPNPLSRGSCHCL